MPDDNKSAIDQAIDLLFFWPVGLAVTAREDLPRMVEKGRQRVSSQVFVARMLGQFAVSNGQREASKAASRLVEQAGTVASRLGELPGIPGTTAGAASAADSTRAASDAAGDGNGDGNGDGDGPRPSPVGPSASRTDQADGSRRVASAAAPRTPAVPSTAGAAITAAADAVSPVPPSIAAELFTAGGAAPMSDVGPTAESLAIPGYDSLSASQVVQRLAGLSAAELDAVRRYEDVNRGRRTILSKVALLEGDPA